MLNSTMIAYEVGTYRALGEQLRAEFANLDDETLADTLEGLSDLPQMVEELVRSCLDDEALAAGLKTRLADMAARLARFQERAQRKRELASKAMAEAGLKSHRAVDFSVGLRQGPPQLVVEDEGAIPDTYLVPQPPKLDRQAIATALKLGLAISGAKLEAGRPHISVRTK